MSLVADHNYPAQFADEPHYRALSPAAVASLVAGGLSIASFLSPLFWVIPVLGVLLATVAIQRIRSDPENITGRKLALAGLLLSAVFGGLGAAWQTYAYVSEVPDGYQRISYSQLQPESAASPTAIPGSARLLDGKKVFIKGYMYPGAQRSGIREFVLVRDQGTCCFGGPTPKLTDMIQVRLKKPLSVDYTTAIRSFAGVFHVQPALASDNLGGVLYHLDADYVK
jgi:hypothetical protein